MRGPVLLSTLLYGVVCFQATPAQTTPVTPLPPAGQPPGTATYDPLGKNGVQITPLTQPTLTPGVLQLLELETKFASAVAAGGGKAFSSWFADDAVSLANGRPPVMGRTAIAAEAQWDPKDYQLTWQAQGAQMGPSNDMGFTWGHYEGTSKDQHGQIVKTSGRYFTVWKKVPGNSGSGGTGSGGAVSGGAVSGGTWKVALDASAEEPAESGSCCTLPKP